MTQLFTWRSPCGYRKCTKLRRFDAPKSSSIERWRWSYDRNSESKNLQYADAGHRIPCNRQIVKSEWKPSTALLQNTWPCRRCQSCQPESRSLVWAEQSVRFLRHQAGTAECGQKKTLLLRELSHQILSDAEKEWNRYRYLMVYTLCTSAAYNSSPII